MACETCDHTMQRVNIGEPHVFWCPRCGTIKTEGTVSGKTVILFEAPKLVGRAYALCAMLRGSQKHTSYVMPSLDNDLVAVRECCTVTVPRRSEP